MGGGAILGLGKEIAYINFSCFQKVAHSLLYFTKGIPSTVQNNYCDC